MAASDYVPTTDDLIPGTKARADDVNEKFDAVNTGFDKLQTPNELYGAKLNWGVDSGTANAFVVTKDYPITSLVAGVSAKFIATTLNTGACTLNVDGTGVKSLIKQDGMAFTSNDIPVGMIVNATYDGTDYRADNLTDIAVAPDVIDDAMTGGTITWSSNKISTELSDASAALDAGQLDSRYYTETELDAGQLDSRYYTETELDAGQLDSRYYTETEIDTNLYTKTELDAGQLDNRYYTETEIDTNLYTKTELDAGQLDNRYYTEAETDATFIAQSDIGVTVQAYDADIPSAAATVTEMEAGVEADTRFMSPQDVKSTVVGKVGEYRATADGAITAGAPVIINTDGTVTLVGATFAAGDDGTEVEEVGTYLHPDCAYIASQNVVVFAYRDGSDVPKAVAATVTGSTLSAVGTPVNVIGGSMFANTVLHVVAIDTDYAIVVGVDVTNNFKASLMSFSGTTITVEQTLTAASGTFYNTSIAYDPADDICLAVGNQSSVSSLVSYMSLSRSGTSITVGTVKTDSAGTTTAMGAMAVANIPGESKFAVSYVHDAGTDERLAFVTVDSSSPSSLTVSPVVFTADYPISSAASASLESTESLSIAYSTVSGLALAIFVDGAIEVVGVYDPDAETVDFDSVTEFNDVLGGSSTTADRAAVEFDPNTNLFSILYADNGNFDYLTLAVCDADGTGMQLEQKRAIVNAERDRPNLAIDTDNDRLIACSMNSGDDLEYQSVTAAVTSTNADDFAGLASEAISDTADGIITALGGINDQQSGLTPGVEYWVDMDGSLAEADTGYAKAGRAISATEIITGF